MFIAKYSKYKIQLPNVSVSLQSKYIEQHMQFEIVSNRIH